MTGKIKIALCLSGDPRNDVYAFPYMYKHFISNPLFDTDVYTHSWKHYESLDLYKPIKSQIEYNQEENIINQTISKLDNINDIELIDRDGIIGLNHSILMFNSIYKCFKQIKNKYDIYIRARFDSYCKLSLNYLPFIQSILNKEFDIFIPKGNIENNYWNSLGIENGYNDRFAIGNYEAMLQYSNTFLEIVDILNQTLKFSSHLLLYKSLNLKNLKINYYPFYSELLRDGKLITDNYGSLNYI